MSQKNLQPFRRGGGVATEFPVIPATKPAALEISCMAADLLAIRDEADAKSFLEKDFPLETVGLSSIQIVSLTISLRKMYDKKIKIRDLRRQALTV